MLNFHLRSMLSRSGSKTVGACVWKIIVNAKRCASNTVFALSSGSGKCGVAIIRVSGSKSKLALEKLCRSRSHHFLKPRVASLRTLKDPLSQEVLDKALVLWFPGPHSFTGEDCAEFHVHGGPAVISSVLSALGFIDGLRPALAGDFTKQAFVNGKLDLTEVEALGDLIHAETEAQRKQALRQLDGDLGRIYSQWRTRLIKCLANTEAFIDFHEEENIEDNILDLVSADVSHIQDQMINHLKDGSRGQRLRDGLRVVIIGKPNVGKSSLLNTICCRPAAIVSPIAGTTRDVVETALDIAGYPVLISDTAGLRDTNDIVESEGVKRAFTRAKSADLLILMVDFPSEAEQIQKLTSVSAFVSSYLESLGLNSSSSKHLFHSDTEEDSSNINVCKEFSSLSPDLPNVLIVLNKCDMMTDSNIPDYELPYKNHVCNVSCKTGYGLETFMELLVSKITELCGDPLIGSPSLTQSRHRHHLEKCHQYLNQFFTYVSYDVVLAAERLRLAVKELGHITGAVSTDDILDVIFRDFCIGK